LNESDLVRLSAIAVPLALLWVAEFAWPQTTSRLSRIRHAAVNLVLGGLSALVAGLAFAGLSVALMMESAERGLGLLHQIVSPSWVEWTMGLLLFDLWMYAWHRLNHRIPLLWRFHAVHHSDESLDASSGVRFHPVEILLSGLARLAVLPLLGLEPVHLLTYEAITRPIVFFHHANIRIPEHVDRLLRWLIVTPRMHWVHHSRWQPETDSNFASGLSIWDRAFATFRLRHDPEAIDFGLEGYRGSEARELLGLLGSPFRSQMSRLRASS
jgi:sterol desaturase/sphingolipid hydroxylase (fatty acid hydroxylase superfamily)